MKNHIIEVLDTVLNVGFVATALISTAVGLNSYGLIGAFLGFTAGSIDAIVKSPFPKYCAVVYPSSLN